MTAEHNPLLTSFAKPPRAVDQGPILEVDPCTGLLREPGAARPFVEEMLALASGCCDGVTLDTQITATFKDPLDPDHVRTAASMRKFIDVFSTELTKAESDPEDPDILRLAVLRRFLYSIDTPLTEGTPDQPDPDLIRSEHLNRVGVINPQD